MYSTPDGISVLLPSVDNNFVQAVEPLLLSNKADSWSLKRIAKFGYVRVHATKTELTFEYVNANTRDVEDIFQITRSQTN